MSLVAGTRLGPYEIVAPIGAGGMGEVYKARDPRLGRNVAIKVLPESMAADPSRLQRFEQEARAVAALSHPNILAIFDVGSGQTAYLVTELLDGETLRTAVERGALPLKRASDIGLQLLAGLAAAHGRGIVHRDLKPENLFITREGLVKILDFGLAKSSAPATDATIAATSASAILGTVGYMAPEQVRGEAADARSDLFAVGTILYEMVSGQRAFHGNSPADTMSAVLREQPPDLALRTGTSPAVARIVQRCLEKDPTDRFQSARDVRFAIESISDVQPVAPGAAKPAEEKSIVVLPFEDLSADRSQAAFCEGMAAEIINALGSVDRLRVISRTSAVRCREKNLDIQEIGAHLNVQTVLEGAVRKSGERLRITVQLVSATNGAQVWNARYDRNEGDVFEIQDEIAAAVVENLKIRLTAGAPVVKRSTENPVAYNLYLKGRYFWERRNAHFFRLALEHFERAIEEDPNFALAHSGVADCHGVIALIGMRDGREAYPLAKAAAERAVALDPALAEAHHSLGTVQTWLEFDWTRGAASLARATELNPRLAVSWMYRALLAAAFQRTTEAARHIQTALELEPVSAILHAIAGNIWSVIAQDDRSLQCARRAVELDPTLLIARRLRALAEVVSGDRELAVIDAERAVAEGGGTADLLGALGVVYARVNRWAEAERVLDDLIARRTQQYIAPLLIADICAALDRRDDACVWLERASEERNGLVTEIAAAPHYGRLRDEPRFRALLRRMNLPEPA